MSYSSKVCSVLKSAFCWGRTRIAEAHLPVQCPLWTLWSPTEQVTESIRKYSRWRFFSGLFHGPLLRKGFWRSSRLPQALTSKKKLWTSVTTQRSSKHRIPSPSRTDQTLEDTHMTVYHSYHASTEWRSPLTVHLPITRHSYPSPPALLLQLWKVKDWRGHGNLLYGFR